MGRDASLDDFLGDGESSAAPETQEEDDEPGVERDATTADGELSTFDWSPDGAPCTACGDRVERRWRDDGRLVCGGCKTW